MYLSLDTAQNQATTTNTATAINEINIECPY